MSIDITTLALAKEYTNRMVGSGGTGDGVNGKDGITPHIGDNGNWFIGTVDTGVSAQGPAGENGVTPHIGTNGNWYIGSANTGVSAKGAKGDNGLDGNGIKSAILNSDYTLTLTFDDGTTYTTPSIRGATGSSGKDGPAGAAGKDGTDGVGIASIEQTATSTADGGNNVFTVTLTNGTTATFTVKNGSKGSTGKDGSNGVDGGHYTPVVTQPTTDTMQISFAPSKSDMPAVNPVTVNLPVSENSGQNVELDTTLTKSGKAADSKAVGDEIKRVEGLIPSIEGLAKAEDIPDVPSWALAADKPGYTKSEVGLGNVDNVRQYSASNPPPYPVESVNGQTGAVVLGAPDVGAEPVGAAAGAVSAHNGSNAAHSDIRLLIEGLANRLNALANSTDTDLDQMAEIVAYIKSNKSLLDGITTSKVSVSDIINNLTTNVANRPLSAAQGVAIKALFDKIPEWALAASKPGYTKSEVGLSNVDNVRQYSVSNPPPYPVTSVNGKTGAVTVDVPTKVSQLTNDSKFISAVTEAMITAALGYTPINPGKATLGRHDDGLLYLFVDGKPVGSGVELPTGGIDGYITEDKQIVFNNLPDGEYTLAYLMDDGSIVTIGELVKDTNTYYSVTNALTNCVSSNSATQVVEGGSYEATITANAGYELESVTVTMGGVDITATAVSGGKITIAAVSGDIVVTAVATQIQTSGYTNLADPTSADWQDGYRLSLSAGTTSAMDGHTTTNYIPANVGDVLRIKGLTIVGYYGGTTAQNAAKICVYDSSKKNLGGAYGITGSTADCYGSKVTVAGDVSKYTLMLKNDGSQPSVSVAYIRIDGFLMDGYTKDDVVITINEEITDGEVTPSYTNLFDPAGATLNARLNSSAAVTTTDGYVLTNWMDVKSKTPFTADTKIYMKGVNISGDGSSRIFTYNTTGTAYANPNNSVNMNTVTVTNEGNGVISIAGLATAFASSVVRAVMCLKVSTSAITEDDIAGIVITIDEPIV